MKWKVAHLHFKLHLYFSRNILGSFHGPNDSIRVDSFIHFSKSTFPYYVRLMEMVCCCQEKLKGNETISLTWLKPFSFNCNQNKKGESRTWSWVHSNFKVIFPKKLMTRYDCYDQEYCRTIVSCKVSTCIILLEHETRKCARRVCMVEGGVIGGSKITDTMWSSHIGIQHAIPFTRRGDVI